MPQIPEMQSVGPCQELMNDDPSHESGSSQAVRLRGGTLGGGCDGQVIGGADGGSFRPPFLWRGRNGGYPVCHRSVAGPLDLHESTPRGTWWLAGIGLGADVKTIG